MEFINQESIIRGDESELVISLASIVAKVMRDAKMTALATEYEAYAFSENMGYGTAKHIEALKKFGPSPIHRRSFITRWCSQTEL